MVADIPPQDVIRNIDKRAFVTPQNRLVTREWQQLKTEFAFDTNENANMKSSGSKEQQVEAKERFAFFSHPESCNNRTEKTPADLEKQQWQQIASQTTSGNFTKSSATSNQKNVESFLAYQPVQPYPFTFIAAVKRKLAVAAYHETAKKLHNSNNKVELADTSSKESLYQAVQKMDFIKPLKVPDVKISPKTGLDCSSSKEKFSTNSALQKADKTAKSMERAHRKLDFSLSEGHSLISSDDVEPLTAPDLCISPSVAKKKDHIRDNSREKENRNKRLKKDDTSLLKTEEMSSRSKNPKHVSRKDVADSKRSKNERSLIHSSKETEFTSNKPKSKNFVTSTVKKDEEKKVRSSSIHSTKTWRDKSLESRGRTVSSDSLADRNFKGHEKIASSRAAIDSDASSLKYNDDYQILNALRQLEEQKHKSSSQENKTMKTTARSSSSSSQPTQQKSSEIPGKDQYKRISDRTKTSSTSKSQQTRTGSSASEILEDIETVSDSNSNKNRSIYTEISAQQSSKNKHIESASISQQNSANADSQNLTETSTSSDIALDPMKISFRDESYSQQEEFCDLVTPDINLTLRSKRRKPIIIASENDSDTPKHKTNKVTETTPNVPLLHPTALHMQFQAELHLFDSYNESLRQVMDVENCLYNAKHEKGKELLLKQRQANEEIKKQLNAMQAERDNVEQQLGGGNWSISDESPERNLSEDGICNETNRGTKSHELLEEIQQQTETRKLNARQKFDSNFSKDKDNLINKHDVRVAAVQTQTANDIATQTDTRIARYSVAERLKQYPGITYDRGNLTNCDIPEFSLGSLEQFEDLDHIEDISLPSKMRTMSEISLHETTSSIKTETGTEISISTRDVTCSFNKYLDLEMAQLIKDEKLMYDKIEMLFKSREKTLNDRTRKLVKLEEQKRALRDTGQDSRISSVKKKQRALLLKLQQEKDEMNRLKELHKVASQERKLMLQKQRNMFNPQMSTKNILTKLKRSADCQSPRRLSGPMKGYDIRSNSSVSSLVDSDKSQIDRSQIDLKLQQSDSFQILDGKSGKSDVENSIPEKLDASGNASRKYMSVLEESTGSLNNLEQLNDFTSTFDTPQKLEAKARKFEEKMPSLKTTNYTTRPKHAATLSQSQILELSQGSKATLLMQNVENSNVENVKSESDTLVEELSKKSKTYSVDGNSQVSAMVKDAEGGTVENIPAENDSVNSRKSKASQVTEEALLGNYKGSKKQDKATIIVDKDVCKKSQHAHETKSANKRKGRESKNVKAKPTCSNILTENILRSKGNCNIGEEIIKPSNKRTKTDKELSAHPDDENYQSSILEELDLNESQNSLHALVKHSRAVKDKNYKLLRDIASEHETKENILTRNMMERSSENRENNSRRDDAELHNLGNISTRSQVSTFTISRHSSGDSEKSFSRSVVIRAQDHRFKTSKKLEQVLNAREAALTTRRNCVEDWIAWHTKLKAEENRVARMEQAAFKLVSTTANALPYNDTTMSSDTSDVEGRVELLAEKLSERRAEMSKLKREARRQAKQRLKALEANLLNQIKKYDTTIHEMRKKLETQKTVIKDSDKLAIESRSVADFKVPEIPLKRIQEIYKSSDLLRSRSESDLIFSKSSSQDGTNRNYLYSSDNQDNNKSDKNLVYKSSSSLDNKSSRMSRQSSEEEARNTNQSAESVLEETKSFDYSGKRSEVSKTSKELPTICSSRSEESVAAFSENVAGSLRNSVDEKSAVDKLESIAEQTKKTHESEQISESSQISEAIKTDSRVSDASSKVFSRKLESLHLTNKNLNEDISTLENDLKALSEMMSHFSKKSDEKLKTGSPVISEMENVATVLDSAAKSTGKDVSEDFSKISSEIEEDLERPVDGCSVTANSAEIQLDKAEESDAKISETSPVDCPEEEFEEIEATEIISTIIPSVEIASSETSPADEIDFEARSKEILNVIEQSIISEHVKSPSGSELVDIESAVLEESMKSMKDENEALSQDLNSLEGDIKSISQIILKMAECKRTLELATELSDGAFDKEESKNVKIDNETLDMPILQLEENESLVSSINENEHCEQSITIGNFEDNRKLPEADNKNKSINDDFDTTNLIPETSGKSLQLYEDEPESIAEEISQQDDDLYNESSIISRKSSEVSEAEVAEETEQDRSNESSLESNSVNHENDEEFKENDDISVDRISPENDWTVSDSFQVPDNNKQEEETTIGNNNRGEAEQEEESLQLDAEITIEPSDFSRLNLSEESREPQSFGNEDEQDNENLTNDLENVSAFIPRGESTTIGYRFDDSATMDATKTDSMHTDELDDILDIIARESKQTENSYRERMTEMRNDATQNETLLADPELKVCSDFHVANCERIIPRPTDLNLTAEVEPVLQKLTEILQGVERNIARRRKSGTDADANREAGQLQSQSPKTSETQTSAVLLSTEKSSELIVPSSKGKGLRAVIQSDQSELQSAVSEPFVFDQILANVVEQLSENSAVQSEKNDPDNIEKKVAESVSQVFEENPSLQFLPEKLAEEKISTFATLEFEDDCKAVESSVSKTNLVEKPFEILRDPEYEDISEESLEVSEILDRSESQRSATNKKSHSKIIPEKYEVTSTKSEDVLRILDEISQQSHCASSSKKSEQQHLNDVQIAVQVFGSVSPGFASRKSNAESDEIAGVNAKCAQIDIISLKDRLSEEFVPEENEIEDKNARGEEAKEQQDEVCGLKREQDGLSESSEGADTPRGVSEIEMDSPRDPNESRLDIDALDDDLLSGNDAAKLTEVDGKVEFHVAPVIATSEKDIEAMIDKLKASLEQPGLEVAELEAKLLRIEQLQIELEIKKLEAEEVSFYVREIPNKPPPPYTPPGGGRLATPQVSPTLPPAVVPSNVEELTAFTEKATVLIFNAKNAGEDIMSLQPPLEICELSKDNNETAKQDRRIYNTFLFDLCKETIAELYRSEYEKPGPSWTKPNVKTKPAMKIPKTVEQLNEYVSKEVATLFGFKTKLQRENMVMRWSRKRRDRVDELLAREAQAEEDEWTKFHHDELAVKNELTVAILDTLILETTNVVKAVYAKKRKVMT